MPNQRKVSVRQRMRKPAVPAKICCCIFLLFILALTGCTEENHRLAAHQPVETQVWEKTPPGENESTGKNPRAENAAVELQEKPAEPVTEEVDWSNYFDGINGSAVICDPAENRCQVYNQELALTRRSPCSTFKIISSFLALEHGFLDPDHSTRPWSGEVFWNGDWNRDIDFWEAFRTSCVWYFREVIDEIGADMMQEELNSLPYGNCDISDWGGRLNTNNSNPALTGFWIESSLLISPREQVEVMERIFGDNASCSEETQARLKQAMLLPAANESDCSIYGKTGMGKSHGIVVDAWFTGFAEISEKRIYFCVYLGETKNKNVSSARAREIAVEIVSAYLNGAGQSPLV